MSEVVPNTCKECLYVCKSLFPSDRTDHLMLFRRFVSRKARGKERALLKEMQLSSHTIDECFNAHPLDDEEAVQDGLSRWCVGEGHQPPTWRVLIDAMEFAEIEEHSIEGLKERLGLLGMLSMNACVLVCVMCSVMCVCGACSTCTVLVSCHMLFTVVRAYWVEWPLESLRLPFIVQTANSKSQ